MSTLKLNVQRDVTLSSVVLTVVIIIITLLKSCSSLKINQTQDKYLMCYIHTITWWLSITRKLHYWQTVSIQDSISVIDQPHMFIKGDIWQLFPSSSLESQNNIFPPKPSACSSVSCHPLPEWNPKCMSNTEPHSLNSPKHIVTVWAVLH